MTVSGLRNYKIQPPVKLPFFLAGLFLLFLVLVVLQQANPLSTKLGRDSGNYMYVSNTFLKGGIPYVSAMEAKPPGIFFIDAFGLWIGHGTRWGIWLVEFILLLSSSCIGFYLFHRQFGFGPALTASTVWLLGLKLTLEGGNFTEEYSILFGFCALLFWVLSEGRSKVFWLDTGIGICMGFSILLRPNNIGVQLSIILVMVFFHVLKKENHLLFRRLSVIFITTVIPFIGAGLFFYAHGAFVKFFEGSILYNLSYAGGNIDVREAFLRGIGSLGFSSGIALTGYFVALEKLRRQFLDKSMSSFLLWLVVNGIVEVILSSLSGRSYQHYFICWLVAVASATAVLVYYVFLGLCLWITKHASIFAFLLISLIFLLYSNVFDDYIKTAQHFLYHRDSGVQKLDAVAEYVNANAAVDDLVLVWGGQAGINFLSKRDSFSPYIMYPLYVPSEITNRFAADFYANLQENPPALIVDGSSYSPGDTISLEERSPLKWSLEHEVYAVPYLFEVMKFIRKNYVLKDIVSEVRIYMLAAPLDS